MRLSSVDRPNIVQAGRAVTSVRGYLCMTSDVAMHSLKPQVGHSSVIQRNSYFVLTFDSKCIDLRNGFILYSTQITNSR